MSRRVPPLAPPGDVTVIDPAFERPFTVRMGEWPDLYAWIAESGFTIIKGDGQQPLLVLPLRNAGALVMASEPAKPEKGGAA